MRYRDAFKFWREMDNEHFSIDFKVWLTGGEVYFFKYHYRVRWAFR